MKSAGNGGVLKGSLQVLHVHVFFAAPLGAGHMAQPGTDQHQCRVTVREATHHASAAAGLPVQQFNHIVGADTRPVLAWEIAVGQRFLNTILHLLGCLLQLHSTQFLHHFSGGFLALLSADFLEHLGYQLHLGARRYGEHIAVEVHGTSPVFGLSKYFSHGRAATGRS